MGSFRVVEHKLPCQYIREYPQALAGEQEDTLYLAVKQYIPADNTSPHPNDLTIIAAHANSFPKELYEPLWEDLLVRSRNLNFRIRGIWIADVANQGASGVLNEARLGNDPSLADFSRDLLYLINLKRDEMPRPIIGIGHSMGGQNLIGTALMHPRLFTGLILLDPVLQEKWMENRAGVADLRPVQLATFRRNSWPSREAAIAECKRSPFYKSWDPRALDLWCKYGLRELNVTSDDTASSPNRPVVLTTTPSQESFTFLRPNFNGYGTHKKPTDRKTHADLDPKWPHIYPFYRPEVHATFQRLPELRPPVLYVFGSSSHISSAEQNTKKLAVTGIGVGGSGGPPEGRVKGITLEGVGHMIPMEAVTRSAEIIGGWIDQELSIWRAEEIRFREMWSKKSLAEKQNVDEEWMKMVGGPPRKDRKRTGGTKI
ncbi:uncharacterized protein Z518_05544 [Rhinocladiella mackenziei CBS 650.93]|uniref:AB hydrolase-1 domain-containing protein n=1 Tax=Rhinocladiella mackenziei CBS 650.93 TaxID=1442369 RepID=A0A0D2IFT3_9EURO|nr:uncharacterized protein Z518_05544 [Rhinocladiella mackenziei CBS 650.93]KIX04674.1 hypothetical protein Z518_05544 [Rhinocladiella mackenziei CBS 650.93]